jgi:uncharacterized protein
MHNTMLYGCEQGKQVSSFLAGELWETSAQETPMRELVEQIAKALVDHPEAVHVAVTEGSQVTILELRTHSSDLGKVIGRQGRTAKAIRTLLGATGMKLHRRFTLDIVSDPSDTTPAA